MAINAQLGATMAVGATSTLTLPNANTYYMQRCTEGGRELDFDDTFNADGLRVSRAMFGKYPRVSLDLKCISTANPTTDFPEGTVLSIANSSWFVASAPVEKTKAPHVVTVELERIFESA